MGPLPGSGAFVWDMDQLILEAPDKETGTAVSIPVRLALGSGKTGMTYLLMDEGGGEGGAVEVQHSYFPGSKAWHTTPGQEGLKKGEIGRHYSPDEASQCIRCHAVTVPDNSRLPERKFFGVGCESCHGPGGAHVALMERGEAAGAKAIVSLKGAGGEKLNETCGKCHRTAAMIPKTDRVAREQTQRFQPFGLSLSQCFKQSQDKLTCVTCHNPHADASTDQKAYEKTCLSCHSAPQKVCPVNPKEKCVSCHMPTRRIFPKEKSSVPISMADHFIRIYRNGKS